MFRVMTTGEGMARAGVLSTAHGDVQTPFFMPVATMGAVKTLSSSELTDLGTQVVISNSYLLSLRPGDGRIRDLGGLHRFMAWDRPIFTDSGGFQMIKRDYLQGASAEGVRLRSPYDGKVQMLTPERCMEIQSNLGSDVAMALDDCPPAGASREHVLGSLERTTDWARRARAAHSRPGQLLFAIVQGGVFDDLRERSARELAGIGFAGYGIGGLCIGEAKEDMRRAVGVSIQNLPEDAPRYLMGVGEPTDVLRAIEMGVDVFDSVYPARNARHQTILTWGGRLNIGRAEYADDTSPLSHGCQCPTCRSYTRAYVNHMFKVKELFAMRAATLHNIFFTHELVTAARTAIGEARFREFKSESIERLSRGG